MLLGEREMVVELSSRFERCVARVTKEEFFHPNFPAALTAVIIVYDTGRRSCSVTQSQTKSTLPFVWVKPWGMQLL